MPLMMPRLSLTPRFGVLAVVSATLLTGCPSVAPPASQFPTADSALARMRETTACASAVQANAKLDHFGKGGRFRGDVMMFAAAPSSLRIDIVSPFGVALATLTSDGQRFALADLRARRFFFGPATACNIARLTGVTLPGHVFVDLLRGRAPVLRHTAEATSVRWSRRGYYVVEVRGTRDARETIHLAPHPDDFAKPWSEQRLRVLEVEVHQYGDVLYRARLDEHAAAPMSEPRIDPDGLDEPIPPSGPMCTAELPRRLRVEVPAEDVDLMFRYEKATWNPPLPEGTFVQPPLPGAEAERVDCE
jgi:hypothetical protein